MEPVFPLKEPAISPLALPSLRYELKIEQARCAKPIYAKFCGDRLVDLQRQIEAALSGAPTWTDVAGSVWGAGNLLVGGVVPEPGGNSFCDPLGY